MQESHQSAGAEDTLGASTDTVITLALGTEVDVRCRFDQHWAHGFEVAEANPGGYRLRRHSDGAVLPVAFSLDEVRRRQDLGA